MVYIRSNKTELRKDEKKKLILETAAKVFAKKGYHQTSVKDITDTAEISVGTFYLYFKNKEDLFEKLYDEMEQLLSSVKNYAMEKSSEIPAERFSYVITASLWIFYKYRELAKILLIEAVGLNPRFEQKYANIMVKSCESMEVLLIHLKELGIIDVPDSKVAAIAHEGAINNAITFWLRTDDKADFRVYAYPLVIFSLQALKINFNPGDIESSICEMFQELDHVTIKFNPFS